MTDAPVLAVGLMSGTSLDGMDAALVRLHGRHRAELVAFHTRAYSAAERRRLLEGLEEGGTRALALLHAQLGRWAVEAVEQVLIAGKVAAAELRCIAFHGQTMWHEPPHVTWQLGEPAVLAERFGVPVVSGFRGRDVAAGGQGAPLVPMADVLLFAGDAPRVLLNIGGMANLTFLPGRGAEQGIVAFDTGPGMAVIDAVTRLVDPSLPFDRDGGLAAQGAVREEVLADLLGDPFFSAPPPRSTGRERFGSAFATRLHERVPGPDGVATAAALTAESIAGAMTRWVPLVNEVLVSGGGAHHPAVMARLARALPTDTRLVRFEDAYFPGDAKEAVAFALLGHLTLMNHPGNLPAVTGARGPRVLGMITPP